MDPIHKDHYVVYLFDQKNGTKWTKVAKSGTLRACNQWVSKWNSDNDDVIAVAWPSWKDFDPEDFSVAADQERGEQTRSRPSMQVQPRSATPTVKQLGSAS